MGVLRKLLWEWSVKAGPNKTKLSDAQWGQLACAPNNWLCRRGSGKWYCLLGEELLRCTPLMWTEFTLSWQSLFPRTDSQLTPKVNIIRSLNLN